MPLVLELIPGEDFFVRDDGFELVEIHDEQACTIARARDGHRFRLSTDKKCTIAVGVQAYVGTRGQLGLARVAIDAERSIRILRGNLYRAAHESQQ
jgi:hypothetical protein